MTAEEVNKAVRGKDLDLGTLQRGATRSRQWPNEVVPYVLSKSVSTYGELFAIVLAFHHLQALIHDLYKGGWLRVKTLNRIKFNSFQFNLARR